MEKVKQAIHTDVAECQAKFAASRVEFRILRDMSRAKYGLQRGKVEPNKAEFDRCLRELAFGLGACVVCIGACWVPVLGVVAVGGTALAMGAGSRVARPNHPDAHGQAAQSQLVD